jgi:hypothetical protein
LILRSKTVLLVWFDPLYIDLKCHKFTVGAQNTAHVCQNLKNCWRNISAYKRRKKLRFFLFERTWASEWFKILTYLKIVQYLYIHIVSLQNCIESPLLKCSFFFKFSLGSVTSQLFINEDILNFYHGWVCQRSFKFHIRNRRKLFAAASRCRRRKVTKNQCFVYLSF